MILKKYIKKLKEIPIDGVFENRVKRWSKMGQWEEGIEVDRVPKSRLPVPNSNGYIKRHNGCKDQNGKRVFDPVSLEQLTKKDFVCDDCGLRTIRLSAWDYIDLVLDPNSFKEHVETSAILDKDILNFPEIGRASCRERV